MCRECEKRTAVIADLALVATMILFALIILGGWFS